MNPDRLTGLDSSFLHLERGPAHMHVASVCLFEGPAPSYDEFRDHISARLHLVPRFRQKLRFVPFGQGRPKWVDDPRFNLDYHVRHTALPEPGTEEQLKTFAARVFSQRLDRAKPVWEMWLVDGVEGGRFAIVTKTHHCLVDGVSGVDITTVLFDMDAKPPEQQEPEAWVPRPEPSDAAGAGRGAGRACELAGRDRPWGDAPCFARPGRPAARWSTAWRPPGPSRAPRWRPPPRLSTSISVRTGASPSCMATWGSSRRSRTSWAGP